MTVPQAFALALQQHQAGRLAEAEALYRQILAVQPKHADALHLLGVIAHQAGHHDIAVDLIRQALALAPNSPFAYCNLGEAYRAIGRLDDAVASLHRALELKPNYPEAHNNLGTILAGLGQLDEAIAAFRRALALKPEYPDALSNIGNALKDLGQLDQAIQAYRRALQIKPDQAGIHSNLIYALHLYLGHDAKTIFEEHQRWNRQFGDPLKPFLEPHDNDRNPERPLRIGYVSRNFSDHPVGQYVLPLLECHDRERFEFICYSGSEESDWITDRLRALAGNWRNTVGVSDAMLAEMIRDDGVDVLVDLAMHTAGNRLLTFARQPAPVQVAWLAYPGSTGLHAISYRLTDARMDPLGEKPVWSAEEPVRLPDSWCCYEPADDSPEINALPALSAEGVTFGSLNNFAKVNEGVLALWARVLDAVKGSRLLMFCPEGRTRERVRTFFSARGIAAERVQTAGFLPRWEYLSLYHRIDLAMDPFPYNGMTITCHALWMGVPVLTLPGTTPVSRAGLSLLSTIGLSEFAASSADDYVGLAVEWAADLPRLAELRATLRHRMQSSPLMDARRFARNVETAYRSMWERWCSGQSPIRGSL